MFQAKLFSFKHVLLQILWPGGVFITKTKKDDSTSALNSPSGQATKPPLQKGVDQSAFFESQLEASRCAHVVHEVLVGESRFW